jgi:hypothetical protein
LRQWVNVTLRQQNVLEEDKILARILDKILPENIQSDTFQ